MVYYAHSKKIYGTQQEKDELSFLESIFESVICPNRDMGELGSMTPYLDKVTECGMVVCSEFNGHIGKGVYKEINEALVEVNPVFVLRNKKLYRVWSKDVKVADPNDWKEKYAKIWVLNKLEEEWS